MAKVSGLGRGAARTQNTFASQTSWHVHVPLPKLFSLQSHTPHPPKPFPVASPQAGDLAHV